MYKVLAKLNNINVKEVPLDENFEIDIDLVLKPLIQKLR